MIVEIDRNLQDLLPRYIRGRQEDLGYLQLAVSRKDFGAIDRICKRIAPTADAMGLKPFAEIIKELHEHAYEHRLDDCDAAVKKMRDFLSAVKPKYV